MKKVLLATSALVASAGVAAAEVSISGWAEMGIVGGDRYGATSNTQFHSDLDIDFNMSGTSDSGIEFGATIDLDEAAGLGTGVNDTFTNATAWIKGSFGQLTLGDTDGALDWAMTEVGMGSSIADDHTTHVGYSGNSALDPLNGGQVLRYDNTFGDFGVALSLQLNDIGAGDDVWQIGVKYNADLGGVDLGIGLGHADGGAAGDATGLSLSAGFAGGFTAVANYTDGSGAQNDHIGLGLGYDSGPLHISANWGEFETPAGVKNDGWGLAANYDLGGGLAVQFGYGSDVSALAGSQDSWSLGLAMSF